MIGARHPKPLPARLKRSTGRPLTSVAAARATLPDTRARVPGVMLFPSGLLPSMLHLQDAAGGGEVALGVVRQYAFELPGAGGYRLVPRFETDMSDAPIFLPVTGGA